MTEEKRLKFAIKEWEDFENSGYSHEMLPSTASLSVMKKGLDLMQKLSDARIFNMTTTISMAHIKPETTDTLNEAGENTFIIPGISVSFKDDAGYYLYPVFDEIDEDTIPQDLKDCLAFMKKYNCTCLCLDRDGEILSELPDYTEEWKRFEHPTMR